MLKGIEPVLRGIGKALRAENDDITREPLPQRWVDLIRHLNEQERAQRNEASPHVAERRRKKPR